MTDVVLTKSITDVNGGSVEPNDVLRYTITVDNSAGVSETNPLVQDLVPNDTTFCDSAISASCNDITGTGVFASVGVYDSTQNAVIWEAFPTTPIAFDAPSSANTTGSASITFSHTVSAGSNRKLIVGVAVEDGGGCTGNMDVTGVTFNTVEALTHIPGADACVDTGTQQRVEMWYLDAPTVTTANVVVTLAGSSGVINAGAVSITGAAGGDPEATNSQTNSDVATIATGIGGGTAGAWIVDMVGSGNGGTFTEGSGQTERWDVMGGSATGAMSTREDVDSGPTSMTQTHSTTSLRNAHGVIRIAPADTPTLGTTSETLTFDVRVDPAAAAGSVISNTASYESDSTTNFESNVVEVTVVGPDLTISKSAVGNPSLLHPNELVTYEISVQNDGAGSAHNVFIEDLFPSNATYVSGTMEWSLNSGSFNSLTDTATAPVDDDDEGEALADRVNFYLSGGTNFADDFTDDNPADADEYNDNDGNGSFIGSWTENDDGANTATTGDIQVVASDELSLGENSDDGNTPSVERAVNLSSFAAASLSFDFDIVGDVETIDTVELRVLSGGPGDCPNNGTLLETFNGFSGLNPVSNQARTYNLTPYISTNTEICFVVRGGPALGPGEDIAFRFQMQVNAGTEGQNLDNQAQVSASESTTEDTNLLSIPIDPNSTADVDGHVFLDDGGTTGIAGNGIQDGDEADLPNVTVTITDVDTNVQTVVTDANGDFLVTVPPGSTTVDVDENDADIPANHTLTTGNDPQTVTAAGTATDFGFGPSNLEISKTSNADADGVQPGDIITYTITIDNTGGSAQEGIVLLDSVPTGTTYVPASSTVTAAGSAFRVNEYFIDTTTDCGATTGFTAATCDLTLNQRLASNYFVIVQGSDGDVSTGGNTGPDENYVALTGDPFGTGDLSTTTSNDLITLTRGAVTPGGFLGWVGVVTVVESLGNVNTIGFELLDVQRVAHTGAGTSGSDNSGTAWSDINQVMLMGGFNGAGCDTTEANVVNTKVCHVRISPSGNDQIDWTRNAGGATLSTATSTVMVLEWTVQRDRVQVASANAGNGINATGEYNLLSIATPVERQRTWIWGTGHTDDNGIGDAAEGVVITAFGNGGVCGTGIFQANPSASEDLCSFAVGLEFSDDIDFEVYALTHSNLSVDFEFINDGGGADPDGDSGDFTVDVTVASARPWRMGLGYNSQNGTGTAYPRPFTSTRYLNDTTLRMQRRRSGQPFAGWVQGIDWSSITTSAGGTPVHLITPASISAGGSATVTFQVEVDDPLADATSAITNTATLQSNQVTAGVSDDVTDNVRPAVSVTPNGAIQVPTSGSDQTVDFFHTVTNDASFNDSFDLDISGDMSWTVQLIDRTPAP